MHFSYSCTYTFDVSFVSFAIFSTISKVKEKGCFGQTFCAFKILLELEQLFTCLKNDCSNFKAKTDFFLSSTHKYANSVFSSWIPFSIASTLFQDFLPNQTHIAIICFWFLETQGSTLDSICGLLLPSRAPKERIDTAVSI